MPSRSPEDQSCPGDDLITGSAYKNCDGKAQRHQARHQRKLAQLEATRQSRRHLGDPTPLPTTAQGVFHWDLTDQVEELVAVGQSDPALAFVMRMAALCSLPRTNPGEQLQYVRRNGPFELRLTATGESKLPYGNIPRLLLAWVCTEAVRTKSPRLSLGRSLSKFMRNLDLDPDAGGPRSNRERLRDQIERLFRCAIRLSRADKQERHEVAGLLANELRLWWDVDRPEQANLWESYITLGSEFFAELMRAPVPIDMKTLRAMKRSTIGLDIYLWTTCRVFTLKRPLRLTWDQIYRQFGPDPAKADDSLTVSNFRKKVVRELKKLKRAWPTLSYKVIPGRGNQRGVLELRPSAPRIPTSSTDRL